MENADMSDPLVFELSLSGKLGAFFGVKELEEKLEPVRSAESGFRFIRLDLRNVEYISSAAIRVVLQTQKAMSTKKGHLVICGLQPACRDVFRITGIDRIVPVFETREESDIFIRASAANKKT